MTGAEFQKKGYLPLKGKPIDIFVSGNYAYIYLQSGKGFQVINISDPDNPFEVGFVDMPGTTSGRLYVSDDYAYVATFDSGLRILDISNPSSPALIATYDGSRDFISVFVTNDLLYAIHGNYNQLVILDVSTPSNPVEISKTNFPDGNENDIFVRDNYAYIAKQSDPNGLLIMDVSDPANPTVAARIETTAGGESKGANRVCLEGDFAYLSCFGST